MPQPSRTGSQSPIVLTNALTKVFSDFWLRTQVRAVDNLDLRIDRGQVFGLIGPNGSGKSTTIKMILGLLQKTSGQLAVFGRPPTDIGVKKLIGYLPEDSYIYPFLNSRETLEFYGKLFGYGRALRKRRIDELLEMVGLDAVQYRAVGQFSKGMQRRVGIAQALINDPEFLILDEPTSGLDPIGIRQIKDLIIDLGRRGKTILLSSHLLSEVEDVCDSMTILYGGRKRAEGTCDELLISEDRTIFESEHLERPAAERVARLIEQETGKKVLKFAPGRQSLESLFMSIVERAQKEKIKTFGAGAGGPTADFLRGEGAAAGAAGRELIDELLRGSKEPDQQAGTDRGGSDIAEAAGAAQGVDDAGRDSSRPLSGDGAKETRAADVNRGVLDALTSDETREQAGMDHGIAGSEAADSGEGRPGTDSTKRNSDLKSGDGVNRSLLENLMESTSAGSETDDGKPSSQSDRKT